MKAFRIPQALAAMTAVVTLMSAPALAQDAVKGEQVFKKCMACHKVGDGAKNGVGPQLNNLFGRHPGTVEGYSYSALNKSAEKAGLVWSAETLMPYLADPNAFLKKLLTDAGQADKAVGATKMPFKLPNEQERQDVIAYLKRFSP